MLSALKGLLKSDLIDQLQKAIIGVVVLIDRAEWEDPFGDIVEIIKQPESNVFVLTASFKILGKKRFFFVGKTKTYDI